MKKILIILWFVIIWLFGFWNITNADCIKDISACVEMWPTSPGYSDCMQAANNEYNSCLQQEQQQQDTNKASSKKFCEENWWTFVDDGTEDGQCIGTTHCKSECMSYAEWSARAICECRCEWNIVLNTEMPFIWRCLEKDSNGRVVGEISSAISKILMSLILVRWFGNLIYAWVLFASNNRTWGKKRVINTIVAFAVLGSVWLILRLINPNIFK